MVTKNTKDAAEKRIASGNAEPRQFEAALRISEERLKLAVDSGQVGIWDLNLQTNELIWDDNMFALYGARREDFSRAYDAWSTRLHPEDRAKTEVALQDAVAGIREYEPEFRVIWTDGETHYIKGHAKVVRDEAGNPLRMVGTNWDNSAHAYTQQQLRLAHAAINQSGSAFFWVNPQGQVTEVNDYGSTSLGYSREELIGQPVWKFDPEVSAESWPVLWDKTKKSGTLTFETRHRRRDGSTFPIEITIHYLVVDGKEYNFSFSQNITERKTAEVSLRKSEERYHSIVSASPMCIHEIDMAGRIISMNPAGLLMMGIKEEREVKGYLYLNAASSADRERVGELLAKAYAGQTCQFEFRSSGSPEKIFKSCFAPILNDRGCVEKLLGITEEISECKKIEDALRESEERFRNMANQAPALIWMADTQNMGTWYNKRWFEYTGRTMELELGFGWIEGMHPDDRPRCAAFCQKAFDGRQTFDMEFRLRRADGNYGWIADTGVPRFDDNGQFIGYIGYCWDITERKTIESQLRKSRQLLEAIVEHIPVMVFVKRASDLTFELFNRAGENLLGYSRNDLLGKGNYDFWPKEQGDCFTAADRKVLSSEQVTEIPEEPIQTASGETRYLHTWKIALREENDEPSHLLGISIDITERKRALENLLITASVFDSSQEAILITDANNAIIDVNSAFSKITGYSRDEVLGKNPKLLNSGHQDKTFYTAMWETIAQKKSWRGEIWNRRKSGEIYAEQLSISAIRDNDDKVQRYVAVFSDISHIKAHEDELSRVAHYDALTGIPNRVLLSDRMRQAIAQTAREQTMMAVCYLDLDGFKQINDTLGHEAGDQVLIEIAKRIGSTIRGGDSVARLGGDEFVVLLLGLKQGEECATTLERLLAAIAQPITVKNKPCMVSASIGVSIYPLEDVDSDTLLRHADQAMYVAKQSGKNRFHIYDPALDKRARDQHEFLKSIRLGLKQKQFELYYQPKINLRTKKLVGAEALIRWRHPERGLLLPAEFLPYIENAELDIEIGEWVIATALVQIKHWQNVGLDIEVSINISGYHLESPGFMEMLRQQLSGYPEMPPGKFQIEVLETVALNDIEVVRGIIESCNKMGVAFALDDFGTGYSSLSYLSRLPVDVLKIDQSFVRDMLEDKGDMAIVQGIVALARAFERQTVAEGIETDGHYQALLDMGCELGQGYRIAHPMTADELMNWLPNDF